MRRSFSHWLLVNGTSKSAHGAEGFDFEVAKTIQQIARLVLGGPFSGGVVRSQAFTIAWSFTLGSAVVLPANLFEGSRNRRQYDITRDGKRFLASVPARRYRKVENKAHHVHGGLSESTEILRIR